jgi:hypothetical protein
VACSATLVYLRSSTPTARAAPVAALRGCDAARRAGRRRLDDDAGCGRNAGTVRGQRPLGQLLATWAVHDLNHLGQIVNVLARQVERGFLRTLGRAGGRPRARLGQALDELVEGLHPDDRARIDMEFLQRHPEFQALPVARQQRLLQHVREARVACPRISATSVESGWLGPVQGELLRGGSSAASAFSSQKVMPISRYIVDAVVRCSCAFTASPVRR